MSTSYDFSGFLPLDLIDGHTHFIHPECLPDYDAVLATVPCRSFHSVCLPNLDGSTQNDAGLFLKQHHPEKAYVSGALQYDVVLAKPEEGPANLAAQILALKEQGFDGLKLIEGKPEVRKLLPHPLDGPLYAGMWTVLEQEQFPVIFHVADPDVFWDAAGCPNWARAKGWDYSDGSYPSKEDLYGEVDAILQRHPHLKITFPHFCFLSEDLPRAARFLDRHPTVSLDLAPHMDMYRDFSDQAEAAHQFFVQYQDRILYGTDIDTRVLTRGAEGFQFMLSIPWLIRSLLELDDDFETPAGGFYQGLGLPVDVLQKIYSTNFERIYGSYPAPLKVRGADTETQLDQAN
jgi:predicted TIM-barrel fold metal-dependent hydrolase